MRLVSLHVCLASLLIWLALFQGAHAHADFRGSDPASEVLLEDLPETVSLDFSEPVGALSMTWLLPDGQRHQAEARSIPQGLAVSPPPDGGRGSYALAWRVSSTDGHPISGALVFSVGHPSTPAGLPGADDPAGAVLSILTRTLAMAAMIVAVGGAAYAVLVAPPSPLARRAARIAALAAVPLSLLALGAYGLDLLAARPAALAQAQTWQAALGAPRGWSLLLAAAAALVALRGQVAAMLAAMALGAASMAVSGHAATGGQPLLGQAIMAIHAAALVFWLGGLVALLAQGRDRLQALRRFSALALPAVVLLVATGLSLVLLRGADWQALVASGWGRLLAAKLALVAAMLGLALLNRHVLTPALARGDIRADRRLRRSVSAEIALGAGVLLLAMCFRLTPPPGMAPEASHSLQARLEGAGAVAELRIDGALPGQVAAHLHLSDAQGAALAAQELRLDFTDPAAGIGPIAATAHPADDGHWHIAAVTLPTAGPWAVEALILVDDFTQLKASGLLGGHGH
ncbi:copper resistance CopC/CopD family protein [Paracoccus siganidrum]|uniref:Copper resistance protein CopC n=1 Tax=Paracoccus siganidrum TaxID=1276757 RepID=A0A419A5D4_9RHOB|nr:CopD family protein [Paracoccus siganidrum]RJL11091.1 copper resistance protein CopC [Paracoccus siganidrum]